MADLHDLPLPERVKAICNQLYSQGTKVSVRLVLAQLPEVKSTSTIHKYYAEWKQELDASQQSLYDRLGFSPDFSQAFMKEISRFSVEAESRYKDMATDAHDQRAIVIEDLTRADERNYKQSLVVEQLEKELKALQAEVAEAAKGAAATQAELRKQVEELKGENKQLAGTNESLRTEIAKAQLVVESNERYVAEVKNNHQTLVEEAKTLNTRLAETARLLAHQEAENTGHRQLIEQLRESDSALKSSIGKREAELTLLQTDLRVMRTELETSHRQGTDAQSRLVEMQKRHDDLQRTITEQATVIKTFTEAR